MGRPTKLDDDTQGKLVRAIQVGSTYELACKYAGITYTTFRNWIIRAEEEIERVATTPRTRIRKAERPFVEFLHAIKEAEGRAAIGWLAKIEKAANDGTWQAAAWKLERRYPQDYGRKVTELQGREGGPVEVDVTDARTELTSRLNSIAARNKEAADIRDD